MLRSKLGKIVACDQQGDKPFQEALLAGIGGDANLGSTGSAVSIVGSTGELHVAHVLPSPREHGGKRARPIRLSQPYSCARRSLSCRIRSRRSRRTTSSRLLRCGCSWPSSSWGRSRDRRRARNIAGDRQNASLATIRQDGHKPTSRSGQDCCGLCQPNRVTCFGEIAVHLGEFRSGSSSPIDRRVRDGRSTFHCGRSVPRAHHWQLDPTFRTNPSGSRHGRIVP